MEPPRKHKNFDWLLVMASAFCLVLGCNAPLPEVIVTEDKVKAIEKLMERFYENEQFYGTILISVNGETLYQHATGYANRDSLIPNTMDTKFRIASATKQITAILILQMVEQGRLRLEDALTDILPEYPRDKGRGITVRHLLQHRSGIVGEPRVPDLERIEKVYHSRQQMLDLISSFDLVAEPGRRYEYSNFGYYLLGVILERVSGKPYAELLQERICGPLGMVNTLPDVTGRAYENRATGYRYNYFTGPELAPHLDMSFVFGYGHLLSTAEDLSLFDQALYGNALLSDKALKRSFFDGLGWLYRKVAVGNSGRTVRANLITASVNGFKCNMLRIAEDRIFIVQLTNHKEHNGHIIQAWGNVDITSRILAILYDQSYDLPRKSAAYDVFRTLINSGEDAATARYNDLYENKRDRFWFKDEEFEILAKKLYEAEMPNLALAYCELAPATLQIRELKQTLEGQAD